MCRAPVLGHPTRVLLRLQYSARYCARLDEIATKGFAWVPFGSGCGQPPLFETEARADLATQGMHYPHMVERLILPSPPPMGQQASAPSARS